jgi:hypothetical protein
MTRKPPDISVVRWDGMLSSGCTTTVSRQQTASHRAQFAGPMAWALGCEGALRCRSGIA